MTLKIPFFISPAYSVPKMTIWPRLTSIATLVVLVTPGTVVSAGHAPAHEHHGVKCIMQLLLHERDNTKCLMF